MLQAFKQRIQRSDTAVAAGVGVSAFAMLTAIIIRHAHDAGVLLDTALLSIALFLSAGVIGVRIAAARRAKLGHEVRVPEPAPPRAVDPAGLHLPEAALPEIGLYALTVCLGADLAAQVLSAEKRDHAAERLRLLRKEIARETGVAIPAVRVMEQAKLEGWSYTVLVHENVVASGSIRAGGLMLAMGRADILAQLNGEDTREPVYGQSAKWIAEDEQDHALALGALVFDDLAVIASHLGKAVRDHVSTLFGRQECDALIEYLRGIKPALIKEVGTNLMPLWLFYEIWKLLLREQTWPRDPIAVIEALLDEMVRQRAVMFCLYENRQVERSVADFQTLLDQLYDPVKLVEVARRAIVPTALRRRYAQKKDSLRYMTLSPDLTRRLKRSQSRSEWSRLEIPILKDLLRRVADERRDHGVCFLRCAPDDRAVVGAFFRSIRCELFVYASDEIPADVPTEHHAVIGEADIQDTDALPAFPV